MIHVYRSFSRHALAAAAFAALLFAASPPAGAAQQPGGERLAELQERLEEARARLKLTDEQTEQIRPILRAGLEKQMAVLEKHGIDLRGGGGARRGGASQQRLRELRALGDDLEVVRKETRKQLKDVLSKEQFKEFRTIQEEGREAMRQAIRERTGAGSGFGDRRGRRRIRN